MQSTTNWVRGTTALSRLSPELSPQAKQRLQWITHVEKHGNKSLTCRYFGISRPTLDRALKRYDPRRRAVRRPYATRKPKEWSVTEPGDLIQFDTQKQSPEPGITIHHFGARDTVSRWDVVGVYSRATARNGRDFLRQVLERKPFPVKAVQIDGGSEFKAEFEEACAALALPLFVLPPHSPKLNGRVVRGHRTHEEEFYQCYDGDLRLTELRPALARQHHPPPPGARLRDPVGLAPRPPETENGRRPDGRRPSPFTQGRFWHPEFQLMCNAGTGPVHRVDIIRPNE
ncbi:MAG: DDE-type integrase/transposase/recombinase [Chloroflexi bacterium]|nr:DDE-type integrase/transposase/recombinase [Chloroflexota bacterium]